jgi:hypothetical protein
MTTTTTKRRRPASFRKLAETYAQNASRYKSQAAIRLAIARVRKAYARAGSYGCDYHLLDDAVRALKDRASQLYFCSARECDETPDDHERVAQATARVLRLASFYRVKYPRWV